MQHGKGGKEPRGRPSARPGRQPATPGAAYWIYGQHAVAAALGNRRRQCLRLVLAEGQQAISAAAPAPERLPRQAIGQLLPAGAVHQGVALLVRPLPEPALEEVLETQDPTGLVVVLDQISDARNLGAILRTAAAFGARAALLPRDHSAPENGALAKAASGALEMLPLIRVHNLARALDRLAELGYWRYGLAAEAEERLDSAVLPAKVAVVLGAEGRGLRRLTRERCDHLVRLPTGPAMPSLNVAAAAALALYIAAERQAKP
jgi:23S rRNA (guanosine2251-2'-O)-methyltransferase